MDRLIPTLAVMGTNFDPKFNRNATTSHFMKHIDPSYLRYIHSGLATGYVQQSDSVALPVGLITLYENDIFDRIAVRERSKLIQLFSVWALLEQPQSIESVAQIIIRDPGEIKEFLTVYFKYFKTIQEGKYELYHLRFRTYILQRNSPSALQRINDRIISTCQSACINKNPDELYRYALAYLSHHLRVRLNAGGDLNDLEAFVFDSEIRGQQFHISKGHNWTLRSLRDLLQSAVLAGNENLTVRAISTIIDLELGIQSNLNTFLEMIDEGKVNQLSERLNLLIIKRGISSDKGHYFTSLLAILFMRIAAPNASTIHRHSLLQLLMAKLNENSAILKKLSALLPGRVRFHIAYLLFSEGLPYQEWIRVKYLSLSYGLIKFQPNLLSISLYRTFIEEFLQNDPKLHTESMLDSFLFSAIHANDQELALKIKSIIPAHCSLSKSTALSWLQLLCRTDQFHACMDFFLERVEYHELISDFLKQIRAKLSFDHIYTHVITHSDEFLRHLFMIVLAQESMISERIDLADFILDELANEVDTNLKDEFRTIKEIIAIKRLIFYDPSAALLHLQANPEFADHIFAFLFLRDKEIALTVLIDSGLSLFDLSDKTIVQFSRLMGEKGMIDAYLKDYEVYVKDLLSKPLQSKEQLIFDDYFAAFLIGVPDARFEESLDKYRHFILGDSIHGMSIDSLYLFNFRILYHFHRSIAREKLFIKGISLRYRLLQMVKSNHSNPDFGPNWLAYALYFLVEEKRYVLSNHVPGVSEDVNNLLTNVFQENSRIKWNHDWHLFVVARQLFTSGNVEHAVFLLKSVNQKNLKTYTGPFDMKFINLVKRIFNFYHDAKQYLEAAEMAELIWGEFSIDLYHKLSKIVPESAIEIRQSILTNLNKRIDVYRNRSSSLYVYTRDSNQFYLYKGMIKRAEVLQHFAQVEESNAEYAAILELIPSIISLDYRARIQKLLFKSILMYKCVQHYPVIIQFIVKLGNRLDEGWINVIQKLQAEIQEHGLAMDNELLDKKIELYNLQKGQQRKDVNQGMAKVSTLKKNEGEQRNLDYLKPFEEKRSAFYGANPTAGIQLLIELAAYKLFVERNPTDPVLTEIDKRLDLGPWLSINLK